MARITCSAVAFTTGRSWTHSHSVRDDIYWAHRDSAIAHITSSSSRTCASKGFESSSARAVSKSVTLESA